VTLLAVTASGKLAVDAIMREPLRIEIERVRRALSASWSEETSSLWTSANPARGQCSVTALVVQQLLGGEILKTDVDGQWHFYNRLEGEVVDFTAVQFDSATTYLDLPATAEEAFADTSREQFETLMESVERVLSTSAAEPGVAARRGPRLRSEPGR
jgi:hypothetical protein